MDTLDEVDVLAELEQMQLKFEPEEEEVKAPQTSFYWEASDYPKLSFVATQIERMGFEIASYDENTMVHRWIAHDWECTMHPSINCIRLNYKQPSGTMFSELVMSTEESSAEKMVEEIANSFFFKGDDAITKMIERDRMAWNKQYSKKLGHWS